MIYYIGIGTNLGNRQENIAKALQLIQERTGRILRHSKDFISEPWEFSSENTFLNIAIALDSELSPIDLLHQTQAIEREMGRTHKSVNGVYHDRIIDIDLLECEGITIHSEELNLPHPLINQRDFVYIPLQEVKMQEEPHS